MRIECLAFKVKGRWPYRNDKSGGSLRDDAIYQQPPPIRLRTPLVVALLALTALALAAVLATPGSAAAQDGGTTYVTVGDTTPCGPGAADPPANPAAVNTSGQFALFDVYWDNTNHPTSGKTLNANLCPPAVTNSRTGDELSGITETFTRAASNIDIGETLFHIPTGNEVSLATTTVTTTNDEGETYPTTFGADRYGFLGNAGDRVWIISAQDPRNPGFSTALLPDDFLEAGTVQFEIEAVRVPGKTVADRGVLYAFDNADRNNSTSKEVRWRSDAPGGLIAVPVGSNIKRYKHLHWAFTKPGIYQLQVRARATPTADYLGRKQIVTVTSEVRRYTFQVGELADLGVTVTPDNATPSTGSNVVITYTASNSGPDAAGVVKVKAPLPDGLTSNVSAATATGSYASATGEWTVGSLASGASATLAITATVDRGTAGDTITPTAYIRDTGNNPVLDVIASNNRATATLRPGAVANSNSQFRVVRSIAENVSIGAPAGAPVTAADDDGDSLTYTLSGRHSDRFTVDRQGQIATSECGVMDYEARAVYPLTLSVRDSKNSDGTADTAEDASIGVTIRVADTVDEAANAGAPTVDIVTDRTTLTVGEAVTLTAVPGRLPACSLNLGYFWQESRDNGQTWYLAAPFGSKTATIINRTPGGRLYRVYIPTASYPDGTPAPRSATGLRSQIQRITWEAASR